MAVDFGSNCVLPGRIPMFKGNILLVEDNPDDGFAFNWAIKKAGISDTLNIARDGQEALNYLKGEGKYSDRIAFPIPDLIFLDLKLPYFNVIEVLAWIR